jgi:hypothetical protein
MPISQAMRAIRKGLVLWLMLWCDVHNIDVLQIDVVA